MYYKVVSYVRAEDPPCEGFSSREAAEEEVRSLMLMHGDDCIFVIESIEESVE